MSFPQAFLDDLRARLPVSTVVGAKVKLKKQGTELVGLSPFQKENTPSFTVNDKKGFYHDFSSGRNGDIFKWFEETEGCTFPEAVERCAAIAGISVPSNGHDRDRRAEPRPRPAVADDAPRDRGDGDRGAPVTTRREITRTYDYTTPAGDLLYQVVRFEWFDEGKRKKSFGQRRPSPDEPGIWIWGLGVGDFMRRAGGDWYQFDEDRWKEWSCNEMRTFTDAVAHGLYRLVELRETGADDVIYLPEGEKDADTFWDWGLPATTNSGGAKNWRQDHAEFFRGRDVVIPVDNDEPGRKRGDHIARSLRGIARRVRVLDFATVWDGAPKGADVTDWKRQREGSADELQEIVAGLPEWTPAPFASRFGGIPFEDLDKPGPEHEYMIDDWMTVGDKSVIGGASKSGKSFLAIHGAGCIATGMDFFGSKVLKPGLVIYQAGEGATGIKKRFRAWRQYFGIERGRRVPIYILQAKIDIYRPDGDTAALIEEIKGVSELYDVPLRALYIDTLAKAQGAADENSGKDMSAVMGNVDKLSEAFPECHVCLVHHFNAAGTKLRGHSSIYANLDQVVLVTKEEGSKIRSAMLDKQKDGEDGKEIKFELFVVEIGKRALDGKPITSCVTLSVGGGAAARQEGKGAQTVQLSDQQTNIVTALKKALSEHGEPTPDFLKLPKAIKTVVKYKKWIEAYRAMWSGDPEADDAAIRQAMKRAGEKLIRLRVIGRVNPYVWLTGRAVAGAVEGLGRYGEGSSPPPREEGLPLPEDAGDLK